MKQGYHAGFVLLVFIFVQIQVAYCINCLNCKNIGDLGNCHDVIPCKDTEICYIEKVLSAENLQAVFNTGCKSIEYCTLEYCNKQAYGDAHSRRKRQSKQGEHLTLCSECCFEDSCNTEGCGFVRQTNNVSQCYSCNEVYEGGPPCTRTVDCDLKLFACSVTLTEHSNHPLAYDLGCTYKRKQCQLLLGLDQQDDNVKCCDKTLCNTNPYHRNINKTAIAMDFSCPTGIARPTTTELPTTKPPLPPVTSASSKHTTLSPPHPPTKPLSTSTSTTTSIPTKRTTSMSTFTPLPLKTTKTTSTSPTPMVTSTLPNVTTSTSTPTSSTPKVTIAPATTKLTSKKTTTKATTTKVTTPSTIPTTKLPSSTEPPPKTLPPVTTTCSVCSGPKFLCEKLFAPTPCPPPNNYCINNITNHKDGTKTVDRRCGSFNTCYREWFLGSSDNDKCRKFNGNDEQRLDFQCTFCCVEDNCNADLHPATNTLYKPV